MTYIVTAGYVTVETAVPGGRARIDIPQGAVLPDDAPAEDRERLLALGHIELAEDEPIGQEGVSSALGQPAKNALKPELVAWIVEHRHEALADVQALTKDVLWERIEAGPLPPPPADTEPVDDNGTEPPTADQQ